MWQRTPANEEQMTAWRQQWEEKKEMDVCSVRLIQEQKREGVAVLGRIEYASNDIISFDRDAPMKKKGKGKGKAARTRPCRPPWKASRGVAPRRRYRERCGPTWAAGSS